MFFFKRIKFQKTQPDRFDGSTKMNKIEGKIDANNSGEKFTETSVVSIQTESNTGDVVNKVGVNYMNN